MTDHSPTIQGAELPASPTNEQIELFAAKLVREQELPWLGFRKDSAGCYTIPVVSQSVGDLVRAILAADRASRAAPAPADTAPMAQAVVGAEMPLLDQPLIDLIGRFGLARTDGLSEIARIDLWRELIAGIKSYAAKCVADPICIYIQADLAAPRPEASASQVVSEARPDVAKRADALFDAVANFSRALEGIDGVLDTGDNEEHTELGRCEDRLHDAIVAMGYVRALGAAATQARAAAPALAREPLTEDRLKTIDYEAWRSLSVDSTKWERRMAFARAIERAHGITASRQIRRGLLRVGRIGYEIHTSRLASRCPGARDLCGACCATVRVLLADFQGREVMP